MSTISKFCNYWNYFVYLGSRIIHWLYYVEVKLRASHIPYSWGPVNKFSQWSKVLNVTAYALRFIFKILEKMKSRSLAYDISKKLDLQFADLRLQTTGIRLSVSENDRSLNFLVYLQQWKNFESIFKFLRSGKKFSVRGSLVKLNPFIHKGLIRVRGRLVNYWLPLKAGTPFDSVPMIALRIGWWKELSNPLCTEDLKQLLQLCD